MTLILAGFKNLTRFSNFGSVTVSVCIPAVLEDVEDGSLSRALVSVARQTVSPNEVIIILSGVNRSFAEVAFTALKEKYTHPSRCHLAWSQTALAPGESRNLGAASATGHVVAFHDADDLMHQEKVEIISKRFRKQHIFVTGSLQLLLHGHTKDERAFSRGYVEKLKVSNVQSVCVRHLRTKERQDYLDSKELHWPITHGHASFASTLLKQMKYDSRKKGEDTGIIRRSLDFICESAHAHAEIVDAPLSYYISRLKKKKQTVT